MPILLLFVFPADGADQSQRQPPRRLFRRQLCLHPDQASRQPGEQVWPLTPDPDTQDHSNCYWASWISVGFGEATDWLSEADHPLDHIAWIG